MEDQNDSTISYHCSSEDETAATTAATAAATISSVSSIEQEQQQQQQEQEQEKSQTAVEAPHDFLNRTILKKNIPKHKYTLKRDKLDARDVRFTLPVKLLSKQMPVRVDLRDKYDKIYNQGSLGSCTANALAMAFDFTRIKETLPVLEPSRLFLYYNERMMENSVDRDDGAELRTGVKACAKIGNCAESMWPYHIDKFTVQPDASCYSSAGSNLVKKYMRIDNTKLSLLKGCLVDGFTFVCGISIYESFESDQVSSTGIVPLPDVSSEELYGGHAVTCVGYDDSKKVFIMRNSWGSDWGDKGHFYIPYIYLTNLDLAADFWTLRSTSWPSA